MFAVKQRELASLIDFGRSHGDWGPFIVDFFRDAKSGKLGFFEPLLLFPESVVRVALSLADFESHSEEIRGDNIVFTFQVKTIGIRAD